MTIIANVSLIKKIRINHDYNYITFNKILITCNNILKFNFRSLFSLSLNKLKKRKVDTQFCIEIQKNPLFKDLTFQQNYA